MSNGNGGNGVAIVAIVVIALLAVAGVYFFTNSGGEGDTTVVEKSAPKDDGGFSLDIKDEDGDSLEIQGD
ncbi:MAG: hypothetical protein R3352_01960 [Salinisphaeraceae bacterium]|nr:hypothetical protein [Salinisphaeraceae bacterium]